MTYEPRQPDEIYLIDLLRVLRREWRWMAGVALPVLVATAAFLMTARSQWEAEAWVQIGQVASAPAGVDPKVESLLRVIERVKTRAFQDEVTQGLGMPDTSPQAALYRHSLKTEPEPYANLFRLFVRGYSRDEARVLAQATVSRLQAIHGVIGAAAMAQAQQRMHTLDDAVRTALADRDTLQRAAAGKDGGMAGVLLSQKNDQLATLQRERADLAWRMLPTNTFPTSMPLPLAVPSARVSPNVPVIAGAGILAALFLGGLAAVARNARRRYVTHAAHSRTHYATL